MKTQIKPLLFIIAIIGMVSLAATYPQQKQEEPFKAKNLKVLPKDITKVELDSIMDGFKAALGVKCNFCHGPSKTDPKKIDFSSDDKDHKIIAREMMEMTAKLNKKYFSKYQEKHGVAAVQCATCHRGKPEPKLEIVPAKKG
ncbi:c-type cytochrome [Pedobacter cryophilus]|uniref:Photosynthetic reaction center cytochrome c subunit n=1 Tax=Pedobacter cryophilus TaxID=2571271 RepID=A0A4U1BZW3_9SPHI|nr:c-type cytochrome [Pedobacter cryophilus]TKB98838.1 c-type cytochrome [Pedobacter cryophilus]